MITAIVLAAGASRRLGQPKQLVLSGGVPLVRLACVSAIEAGYGQVIVVTGAAAAAVERALDGLAVTCVYNSEHASGMASSIVVGVTACGDADGALVMAVDQPEIASDHLRALAEDTARLTATAYAGTAGIPAYFPKRYFAALTRLEGDRGAKALLADATLITCAAAELDIDTPNDLRRLDATPVKQGR